jgi:hypothetical protein
LAALIKKSTVSASEFKNTKTNDKNDYGKKEHKAD